MRKELQREPSGSSSPTLGRSEALAQLERVLDSRHFRTSKRCHSLLRHITERSLDGDISGLKERTLGVEVFGRAADYDNSQDPVVRATAAEIRKRLAQYYQEPEHASELRICLQSGSYIPEFHPTEPVAPTKPSRRFFRRPAAVIAGLAAIAALGILLYPHLRPAPLDLFWAPILRSSSDVLICMGQPVVYNLRSPLAQDRIQFGPPSEQRSAQEGDAIPLKDLVILRDRYITLPDAMALLTVTSFLDHRDKSFYVRGEASTASTDLRERPAILIGGFDNQWTLNIAGQVRFTFAHDSTHTIMYVQDREHPDRFTWNVANAWPDWDITTDYAIVSRVFDVNTDRPVVVAAGITHFGTVAASEFLTDPRYFAELLPRLPEGWQKKNLQAVLTVPVVHGVSGHPHVVASHVW